MQQMINRMAAKHYDRRITPVLTIVQGVQQSLAGGMIKIKANTTTAELYKKVGSNWVPDGLVMGPVVTTAHVTSFVGIIQRSFAHNQHRNVLTQNVDWRTFYHVAARALTYIDNGGAAMVVAPADTVPCFDCGLVLPLANIHIDHQRPQAGNELEPICKVFRAMGLTIDGPSGPKGTHAIATWRGQVNGLGSAGVNTRAAKYTLNDVGKMYYTLAHDAGELPTLKTACMNHVINLRPLCSACNTPNRNVAYY
jgi:hypothetical protein